MASSPRPRKTDGSIRDLVLIAVAGIAVAVGGCGFTLAYLFAPAPGAAATESAFIDISDRLGDARIVMGWGGLVAFDYDNDGDIDLLITNGPGTPNRLMENDGHANFVDVAAQAGLDMPGDNCTACAVGDFNNDGRLDLLIARQFMGLPEGAEAGAVIMMNDGPNGNGVVTFSTLSSSQTGLTSEVAAMAVGVGDLDRDGLLDILIGHYNMAISDGAQESFPSQPDELWRCTGIIDGVPQFAQVLNAGIEGTEHSGYTEETLDDSFVPPTLVFYLTDVDEDGWLDFFTLHDIPGGVDLFHNNGDMTFTRRQMDLLNKHGGWMGMAGSDYDGDSHIDYFATNVGAQALFYPLSTGGLRSTPLLPDGNMYHMLLHNDGGTLTDVVSTTAVEPSSVLPPNNSALGNVLQGYEFGFGTTWIDTDNRGRQDLYWIGDLLVAELPLGLRVDYQGVGRFLENLGDGSFADKTAQRGLFNIPPEKRIYFGQNEFGHSVASCDLNGDGARDLVVVNSPMLGIAPAGVRLFLNPNVSGNHWLTVRLNGTDSNKFGIGARVTAIVGSSTQVREVLSTTGAFTGVQPEAHFGIGSATQVDQLQIRWPNGATTNHLNIAVDQVLTVNEPT